MKFLSNYMRQLKRNRAQHRRMVAGMCALSLLVTLGVVWQLRLPGITLTDDSKCTLEEHTHGDGCYGPGTEPKLQCAAEVHVHTEECKEGETLVCKLVDFVVHYHGAECSDAKENLLCTLPEVKVHAHQPSCWRQTVKVLDPGHTHTDACYEMVTSTVPTCGKEQTEGHAHGGSCKALGGEQICQEPLGHLHTDACKATGQELICGQDGVEGHVHETPCYQAAGTILCGETEGHQHGEACYAKAGDILCGQQEAESHTHTENCNGLVRGTLICTETERPEVTEPGDLVLECKEKEIALHTHEESCYETTQTETGETVTTLICTVPEVLEHIHGEDCCIIPDVVTCTIAEHTHTEECAPSLSATTEPTAAPGPRPLVYNGLDYTITATYDETAALPENTVLSIREVMPDTEEYRICCTQASAALTGETIQAARFFDITFLSDGVEVEPAAPVQIAITYPEAQTVDPALSLKAIHFAKEGAEVLPVETQQDETGLLGLSYSQDSFSISGVVMTSAAAPETPKTEAPNVLNVDYFVYIDNQWERVGSTHAGWSRYTEPVTPPAAVEPVPEITAVVSASAEAASTAAAEPTAETAAVPAAEEDIIIVEPVIAAVAEASNVEPIPEEPDAVALALVKEILEPYGFQATGEDLLTLAIQPKGSDQVLPLFTTSGVVEKDGNTCLTLSTSLQGYNLFYLPNNTAAMTELPMEQLDVENNAFYSVTVEDPNGLIYESSVEIPARIVLPKGSPAEQLVRNAPNVLWSVSDPAAKTEVMSFGSVMVLAEDGTTEYPQEITGTVVRIPALNAKATVLALDANPTFTVQYHAYLNVGADIGTTGDNWEKTNLIDTRNKGDGSGGNLPKAGAANPVISLYINPSTNRFPLKMAELTPIFKDKTHKFVDSPGLKFVNQLSDNPNYSFVELWLLKEGKDPSSKNPDDFTVFTNLTELGFSTDPNSELVKNGTAVLVQEASVIRLVYNPVLGSYANEATFYDYDITDGKIYSNAGYTATFNTQPMYGSNGTSTGGKITYFKTNKQGINSNGNTLGFGNNNTNSGMADYQFNGQYMNKYNLNNPNDEEHGCTYGIAAGLNADGTIKYASGVNAPKMFNETGTVNGKTTFPGYNLHFIRNGDTYTLDSVTDAADQTVAKNLTELNQYGSGGNMPSNNFWPMDYVSYWKANSGMSPGHDPAFGDDTSYNNGTSNVKGSWRRWGEGIWNAMPYSDDLVDHNSYFGMNFSLNFSLTEDYIGPLEYAFYGDDDLWIFLTYPDGTSKLICDIGGVHTSMGEYVDLWDWIKKGDANSKGVYKLSGFYTERGASGSTCWMNFTLPSVSSINLSEDNGDLEITKGTQDLEGNTVECTDLFQFQVELRTSENGALLGEQFRYPVSITRADGTVDNGTISASGNSIVSLYAGDRAVIKSLPEGIFYRVTELNREGYHTIANNSYGYIVSGTVQQGVQTANFINIPGKVLPNTGGTGIAAYVFGGLLLMAAPLKYIHGTNKQGRRRKKP